MKLPDDLGFIHVFIFILAEQPTANSVTPLMLHGTGGDERDLLPLGRELWPEALLGVRGKVLENGMPRFFRRYAGGVFDVDDLKTRTNELAQFLDVGAEQYRFNKRRRVAVGYSNGANRNHRSGRARLPPSNEDGAISDSQRCFTPDIVRNFGDLSVFLAGGMRDLSSHTIRQSNLP